MLLAACALCAALAAAPSSSPSPSPSPSPSGSPVPEIAHVYTSDRTEETLRNAARTTFVVTHDQIVRYGYRTVADALQTIPGVELYPHGALGSQANFGVRGSSSAQTLVLIDGLPAPGSLDGTVELGELPTTGVDRIEVVEGGGSTLYGTGAIGGIINVITQSAAKNAATLRYGSFDDRELDVRTPHVQLTRIITDNDFGVPNGGIVPNSDYQSTAAHGNLGWRMGSVGALLRATLESDHGGAPGPLAFASTTSREDDVNENATLNLTHRSAQAQATVELGATRQQIAYYCNPNPAIDPDCFQAMPSLDTESRLNFSARNAVAGANEQTLYGIDLSRGTVRSDSATPGVPIAFDALAQSAAYVQQSFEGRWGRVYAGLRGERDGALGGEFSPSLGLVARLSGELALKMNAASAFRAPNASELYYPGYGNPSLVPERAQVGDVSLVDSAIAGGATLTWFTNRTNNLIVPEPVKTGTTCVVDETSYTYQPCNIAHALIQGFTFDLRTRPLHGFTTGLNITNLYRAENLDSQLRLPDDPVFAANLRLDYTARPGSVLDSFGASMRMAGARGFVDFSQPLFDQPVAYSALDAYLRLRAGRNMLLTIRGYNLGNERYAAVGGYPMPGRSVLFEVSTREP